MIFSSVFVENDLRKSEKKDDSVPSLKSSRSNSNQNDSLSVSTDKKSNLSKNFNLITYKGQNDSDLEFLGDYEKFRSREIRKDLSIDNSSISIREEGIFQKDFLKILNSPNKGRSFLSRSNDSRKESNKVNSISIDTKQREKSFFDNIFSDPSKSNKIGKLDELNKSEINTTIKEEDKDKNNNNSRLSDDNNDSIVNDRFSRDLYLKNNKNFILKNSFIKNEEVSNFLNTKTKDTKPDQMLNIPIVNKKISENTYSNQKINIVTDNFANNNNLTSKNNITKTNNVNLVIPMMNSSKPSPKNEPYSYYLINNQHKDDHTSTSTLSSNLDNNIYVQNKTQHINPINNVPNNYYSAPNQQNDYMVNHSNLQQSFSNFNLNNNINNNMNNNINNYMPNNSYCSTNSFNPNPNLINQNYYNPNQGYPYQGPTYNYVANNMMYPNYPMNYNNFNNPYNQMNNIPNMGHFNNATYSGINNNNPNYINNCNYNPYMNVNHHYPNPQFDNQLSQNGLNPNQANSSQNAAQKMNHMQYIKNNNINIINNSVTKDMEHNLNKNLKLTSCPNDNNSISLKKKLKVETDILIPPSKPKMIKTSILNYTEMKNLELAENAYFLAKDQGGCRFLQKKIEDEPDFSNNYLFPKLCDNLNELINDSFGNYLLQKVIEYLDENNLSILLKIISDDIVNLGKNPHGTRVIQRVVDFLQTENLIDLFLKIIENHIVELAKDINGNHILQKLINSIDNQKINFIYELINENLLEIATDKHGCCVLQRLIEQGENNQKEMLIETIIENTLHLMLDQYGNYVIQYVVSLGIMEVNLHISDIFKMDILNLCKQKFSSNVIEKILEYSNQEVQENILKEITKSDILPILLFDQFGNYVIQKALMIAKEQHFQTLINMIVPHLEKLKKMAFGLKLYNKLISLYPELLKKSTTEPTKKKININFSSSALAVKPKKLITSIINKK